MARVAHIVHPTLVRLRGLSVSASVYSCAPKPSAPISCTGPINLSQLGRVCPMPGRVFSANSTSPWPSWHPRALFTVPDALACLGRPCHSRAVTNSPTYNIDALVDFRLRLRLICKKFVDGLLGWGIHQLMWPVAYIAFQLLLRQGLLLIGLPEMARHRRNLFLPLWTLFLGTSPLWLALHKRSLLLH